MLWAEQIPQLRARDCKKLHALFALRCGMAHREETQY